MAVNNVTRFLDTKKVKYAVFELPPHKLGAVETARYLEVPPEIVYKSIVVTRRGGGKPILAVIPGDQEVDLKKLARVVGEKKVSPATQKEAEQLTHLQAGGISPLALWHRGFQILIHNAALELAAVHISGGELGLNIRLDPSDLIRLCSARTADIC